MARIMTGPLLGLIHPYLEGLNYAMANVIHASRSGLSSNEQLLTIGVITFRQHNFSST